MDHEIPDDREAAELLGLSNSDFPEILVLARALKPDQLQVCKSALARTPQQYHNWLLDVLLQDLLHDPDPFSAIDFGRDVERIGFTFAVAVVLSLALDPDGKEERRGYSWAASKQLSLLQTSSYANFEVLLSVCVNREPACGDLEDEYVESRRSHRQEVAIQHLPALVHDREVVCRLLEPILDHASSSCRARYWAAINLSLLMPYDVKVASVLLNSLFDGWIASESVEYEWSNSGEIISMLALLSLVSKLSPPDAPRQQATVTECMKLAMSTEPADKVRAEASARKLYIALGLEAPRIVWQDSPDGVGTDRPPDLKVSEDQYLHYQDSILRLQNLGSGVDVALQWFTHGVWNSGARLNKWEEASGQAHAWPPDWADSSDKSWLSPSWLDWVDKLGKLNDLVHRRQRYAFGLSSADQHLPRLAQFDNMWIGLLACITEAIGIKDARIEALTELASTCGGALLGCGYCELVERPSLLQVDNEFRGHCSTGTAIKYDDSFALYAWHGLEVPKKVIEAPADLTVAEIESEELLQVRMTMIERYGLERYVTERGANLLDSDESGILYAALNVQAEAPPDSLPEAQADSLPHSGVQLLRLRDPLAEREWFLRVPPGIQTAKHAVQWWSEKLDVRATELVKTLPFFLTDKDMNFVTPALMDDSEEDVYPDLES